MGETTRAEAKSSEAKREKVPFQKQKTEPSQSISSTAEQILFLQRTIGNRAIGRLIKSGALQAKHRIDQPNDIHEQEAGNMAEQIMRTSETQIASKNNFHIQRACPKCEENKLKRHSADKSIDKSMISTLTSMENKRIQRYTVPANLPCGDVVDWLNNNSPYAPEWAETRCKYSFIGNLRMTGKKTDDGYEIRVKGHRGLSVSVNCPIDRPSWSPTRRTNRNAQVAAWGSMRVALDAHEQQHRQIGQRWRSILETRFREVDFTVQGSNERDARQKVREQIAELQQEWISDTQDAQDEIDPFDSAVLTCP